MFELLRGQSRSAAGAIWYVTIGILMMIWAGLWYYYFLWPVQNPPRWQTFTCVGTILSGFAIGAIGLLFGLIGRGAKAADTTVAVANPGGTYVQTTPNVAGTPESIGVPPGTAMPVPVATVASPHVNKLS